MSKDDWLLLFAAFVALVVGFTGWIVGIRSDGWVALFTGLLFVSTSGLWIVTERSLAHARQDSERQARNTQLALNEARRSADAAIAAQRPWLSADIEVLSPMSFDENGPHLTLGLTVRNAGNTPAGNVQPWVMLRAEPFGQEQTSVEAALVACREWAKKTDSIKFGLSVFPGSASRQEQTHQVFPESIGVMIPNWKSRPKIGVVIAMVAKYQFVGGSGSSECAYRIWFLEDGKARRWIRTDQGPIDPANLVCERLPLWESAS